MRNKLLLFIVVLLVALITAIPALAGPSASTGPNWGPFEPWVSYKDTPSGLHIVKDPLVVADSLDTPAPGPPPASTSTPTLSGWVIFVCSDDVPPFKAPKGFEYDIVAKGLAAHTAYKARAYPLPYSAGEIGPGPPSQDFGIVDFYELGTIRTDGEGEGEIGGFIDLDEGIFSYRVTVERDESVVLTTLPAFTYYDPLLDPPNFPPFPLGSFLWFFGDHVDGFVVE
jgi:hypothetical protein